MPINYGLANLSHYAFVATVVAYALAVLAFACDFAFGRDALAPLRQAREPAADLVTVGAADAAPRSPGAGAPAPAGPGPGPDDAPGTGTSGTPGPAGPKPGPGAGRDTGRMGLWVRVAVGLTALGLAAHVLGVVSRGLAVHRVPWGDMYEFVTTVTCVAVIFFLFLMFCYRAYRLGLFVIGPVVILLGLAETVIYTPACPPGPMRSSASCRPRR